MVLYWVVNKGVEKVKFKEIIVEVYLFNDFECDAIVLS